MNKQDFEKRYISGSGITSDFYYEKFITLKCACGEGIGLNKCLGFSAVNANSLSLKCHYDLYSPDKGEFMIKQAAILINGVICTMPRPARHHDIIQSLSGKGFKADAYIEQGFINESGDYLNRGRAKMMAVISGQVEETGTITKDELFSEDLW